MSIYLNSTQIPGFNLKVSANFTLKSVDISGKTSYTPRAETGDKGKSLNVTTQIKFDDVGQLSQIIDLAEAKNLFNERQIYNVVNTTANALGIRQVNFDGDVQVREDENLQLWSVTFELIEYNSVPEKKENRAGETGVTEQNATGIDAGSGQVPNQTQQTVELTAFEKVLKTISDTLK